MVNSLTRQTGLKLGPIILDVLVKHYFDRLRKDPEAKHMPKLMQEELLYDEATGARLFTSSGYNLIFLKTRHAGAPDVQIDDSVGPGALFHSVYRFDSAVYRQRKRTKYCCGN